MGRIVLKGDTRLLIRGDPINTTRLAITSLSGGSLKRPRAESEDAMEFNGLSADLFQTTRVFDGNRNSTVLGTVRIITKFCPALRLGGATGE